MPEDWARPVVHWDIQARDQAKQREFYSQMFNWQISDGPIMTVPAGIGAPGPDDFTGHIFAAEKPGITLYIQVLDLKASMEKATSLGGAVLSPPFDVPGGPTIARIADPEGNGLVLVQQ
jgi:predicted enzyme related to lactoylglutathione lyase